MGKRKRKRDPLFARRKRLQKSINHDVVVVPSTKETLDDTAITVMKEADKEKKIDVAIDDVKKPLTVKSLGLARVITTTVSIQEKTESHGSNDNTDIVSLEKMPEYQWLKHIYSDLWHLYNRNGWWGVEEILYEMIATNTECPKCKKTITIDNQNTKWRMHPCLDYILPLRCDSCSHSFYPNPLDSSSKSFTGSIESSDHDATDQRLFKYLAWTDSSFGPPLRRLILLVQRLLYCPECNAAQWKQNFYNWIKARDRNIGIYIKTSKAKHPIRHAIPWSATFQDLFGFLQREYGTNFTKCDPLLGQTAAWQPNDTLLSAGVYSHKNCILVVS